MKINLEFKCIKIPSKESLICIQFMKAGMMPKLEKLK